MQPHQLNHSRRESPLLCNKHSNKRSQEEDQDRLVEEDQDRLVEADQDRLVEEEDLQLEDNPQPRNNQYLLQQTSRQWEVSHKYFMEIDPKPMTSLKKSRDTFILMLMSLGIICHTRK